MIKKLVLVLMSFFCSTFLSPYIHSVINTTGATIYVKLDTVFGVKAEGLVYPGKTEEFNVLGWCVTKIWVYGKSGAIDGLSTHLSVPLGVQCGAHTFIVSRDTETSPSQTLLKIIANWGNPLDWKIKRGK